ncbi:cilia- and flagella-associated protein 45-like [Neosynchiropus ocellatus]
MIEQDLLAEQNEQIQREREDRKKAQLMLERVTALKLEQENEIRSLNNKISLALCHAACETQVAEKKKFEELEEEESKRLDAKVQMERQKVYDKRDQMEEDIRHQRIRGRQEICRQIEEHERERMVLRQLREKEMQDIRDRHAQMIQEDIEAAEARREEQRRLIEEVIRINTEAVRIKNEKREKERQDDMRNMEYTINKLDRDARYEAEQKKKKRDKEMELAKLWALQKKAGDHQAEMDAHHAWRHGEIVDGEWRKKQRELALKRAKQEERHQAEIAEQHKFKTHMKALQADKEKREFERLLKEQEHKINKEKIEIEKKRQQLQQHNEAVKLQQDAFRRQEIANRKEKFEEAMRRNEEHDRENRRIAEFKAKKLSDLEKIGLPKKYCSAMQRRAGVMTAGDQ